MGYLQYSVFTGLITKLVQYDTQSYATLQNHQKTFITNKYETWGWRLYNNKVCDLSSASLHQWVVKSMTLCRTYIWMDRKSTWDVCQTVAKSKTATGRGRYRQILVHTQQTEVTESCVLPHSYQ
jgi:hypothetical protein